MTALRAIILDFDGVILESNEAKTEVFHQIFSRFPYHHDAMMAFHYAQAWASRVLKFDHLVFERLGRPGDVALRDELVNEFSRLSRERLLTAPFVRGAEEFLRFFAARIPLVVASVTPEADLKHTLDQRDLRQYFSAVYGCPPWTKGAAACDVLTTWSLPAEAVVLIGDAPGDLRAADDAGIEFIWRRSGIEFSPAPPARSFADLVEIGEHLRLRLSRS